MMMDFHWYCGESACHNHNYYWYEDPVTQFQLIPWDLDNAFENLVSDENPVTPIKDKWHEKVQTVNHLDLDKQAFIKDLQAVIK